MCTLTHHITAAAVDFPPVFWYIHVQCCYFLGCRERMFWLTLSDGQSRVSWSNIKSIRLHKGTEWPYIYFHHTQKEEKDPVLNKLEWRFTLSCCLTLNLNWTILLLQSYSVLMLYCKCCSVQYNDKCHQLSTKTALMTRFSKRHFTNSMVKPVVFREKIICV